MCHRSSAKGKDTIPPVIGWDRWNGGISLFPAPVSGTGQVNLLMVDTNLGFSNDGHVEDMHYHYLSTDDFGHRIRFLGICKILL